MNKVTVLIDDDIIFDNYIELNKIFIPNNINHKYSIIYNQTNQSEIMFKFTIIENDEIIYNEYVNFNKIINDTINNNDLKYSYYHPFPLSSFLPIVIKNENYEINLGFRNLYKEYNEFRIFGILYEKIKK